MVLNTTKNSPVIVLRVLEKNNHQILPSEWNPVGCSATRLCQSPRMFGGNFPSFYGRLSMDFPWKSKRETQPNLQRSLNQYKVVLPKLCLLVYHPINYRYITNKNHSFGSYLHQLSYRTGAPPCRQVFSYLNGLDWGHHKTTDSVSSLLGVLADRNGHCEKLLILACENIIRINK